MERKFLIDKTYYYGKFVFELNDSEISILESYFDIKIDLYEEFVDFLQLFDRIKNKSIWIKSIYYDDSDLNYYPIEDNKNNIYDFESIKKIIRKEKIKLLK